MGAINGILMGVYAVVILSFNYVAKHQPHTCFSLVIPTFYSKRDFRVHIHVHVV